VLRAVFLKRPGQRDRIYVTRSDGTTTGWDFPSYGHGLPHDLCHLVVESELGLRHGFWGLVDQGAEIDLVDNQATLVRAGRRLVDEEGIDLSGLVEAETAVARLTSPDPEARLQRGMQEPHGIDASIRIHRRLEDLTRRWAALGDGESITLEF